MQALHLWALPSYHTYLLDKYVPLVQVQPIPQFQQHSVDRLVGTSSSLVGSGWYDDVYAEDLVLE